MELHGGDIYRNRVELDFSINVNPFGAPGEVVDALQKAALDCGKYPDFSAENLRRMVSGMQNVPPEYLLFGNGASELLMAVVHGILPKKSIIAVPSFYGYEYAARAAEGEIIYYLTEEKNHFAIGKDFYDMLAEEGALLFLANPNNPTGRRMEKRDLRKLLHDCRDKGIYVLLDECFIEFCGENYSMVPESGEYDNLMILRAFTKSFAIPGVRLGYLVCSNKKLRERVANHLPEWNLSCFAHAAGCACAGQQDYLQRTVSYVRQERRFLVEGLQDRGIRVFPSEANFVLCYSKRPLRERLLHDGILIRDCRNFRGLREGFYRIAVKSREENERLLDTLDAMMSEQEK